MSKVYSYFLRLIITGESSSSISLSSVPNEETECSLIGLMKERFIDGCLLTLNELIPLFLLSRSLFSSLLRTNLVSINAEGILVGLDDCFCIKRFA